LVSIRWVGFPSCYAGANFAASGCARRSSTASIVADRAACGGISAPAFELAKARPTTSDRGGPRRRRDRRTSIASALADRFREKRLAVSAAMALSVGFAARRGECLISCRLARPAAAGRSCRPPIVSRAQSCGLWLVRRFRILSRALVSETYNLFRRQDFRWRRRDYSRCCVFATWSVRRGKPPTMTAEGKRPNACASSAHELRR
jgi:hypothetical protein